MASSTETQYFDQNGNQISKQEYESSFANPKKNSTKTQPTQKEIPSTPTNKQQSLISLCEIRDTKNNIHDGLKRKSFRVLIPYKLKENELYSIASTIVENSSKKNNINAIFIVFDLIDKDGSFLYGTAVWAPGGDWESPSKDNPNKLVIVMNSSKPERITTTSSHIATKPPNALQKSEENPIQKIDRNTAYNDLKNHLLNKYSGHYSTVELLLKAGMKDYDSMCRIPPDTINNQILSKLISRYYPSFSTIYLLYKSNKKSYDNLNK